MKPPEPPLAEVTESTQRSNTYPHNYLITQSARFKWIKLFSQKQLMLIFLSLSAVSLGILGYRWWHYAGSHQETDNAYVTAKIHPIGSRVAGTVIEVKVDDNQSIDRGAVLVKLDPRDAQVALQQAQATLDAAKQQAAVASSNIGVTLINAQGQTAQAQGNVDAAAASISTAQAALSEANAGVPMAQAQLAQVNANLVKAKLDYDRYNKLAQQGAVPQAQFDGAKAAYHALIAQLQAVNEQIQQAKARVLQAQKNLTNTQAKLTSTKGTLTQAGATAKQTEVSRNQYKVALAAISQAEAQVKNAQLQLAYTTISALTSGIVGNKTVQVGQRVQPGQTLLSIISDQPWIIANFKETQLEKMRIGQQVEVKLDAFPNHVFKGKIESLSPASGAKFALLPPDNATGNFTKIVQRLPVKIVFESNSMRGYKSRIAPGMSAVVSVELR